jgi:hypothetical protein
LIGVSVFASREQVRISHGFPFFPPLIRSYGGFVAFRQIAECAQFIDIATVIAWIGGVSGEPRPQEELVSS